MISYSSENFKIGVKCLKKGNNTYSLSCFSCSRNFFSVSFDSLSLLDLRFWSWNTIRKNKY